MPSLPITTAALAATLLASTLPLVSAHGYISGIVSDGKYYSGTSPSWTYAQTKPDTPGWYANNQDNGFVAPSAYASGDITCHKGATVGGAPVPVTAGKSVDLQWNTWPESHHGPVITYMAAVSGEFSAVDKANLKWFKVTEGGLEDGSASPGVWATDSMMANNNTAAFTVPSDLKSGNYVVRHEIIALHSAGQEDGAQNYPQCINVKVSGSGTTDPCASGADCAIGTALYKKDDAGILINIYQTLSSYDIPGPKLYGSGGAAAAANKTVKRVATAFRA
ncbi:Polysaccharide monooxygenase Cel61a [Fulvia fulva]|uniref:Polysaccharide monooxygenase Cel61a n=1 Tax=Passalora fulva TaxID=5499 RepID=A0A9Q8L9G4_PASFU|nr:Polysaccharide monooxygenase Cel61a [Fulvia fulva]KAK4631576.1 Polysaccharide monooxygenase Cel61a [Fulvia fulva]KAK4632838.1 Polysaccharide monooxygenase Cel61a [Fulvia fulva]UJO13297.1 Polysaccharide monooxygenase Cel61a [Fulvia fulva]WPV11082.1 Polysaccharide monooxygenase Cel61a [Fulvia fulva]WPV26906.1 Polysaccharide monooxygenase Cel61a [Fulvia fulva]